ncbi:hypothetical protein F3Y30_18045 [Sinorhizobium sp. BG8]|nr:hypothetical protein F3Y30_18045 [Sinorhizobium sp. BG8]
MPISADTLIADARFFPTVQQGARTLLDIYRENPRLTAIFGSQQRWLMAHGGFGLHCDHDPADPASGLYASRFISLMVRKNVASRNTAAAFINEMLAYRFIRPMDLNRASKPRHLEPTETTSEAMASWIAVHLALLDDFDGESRHEALRRSPDLLWRLQPAIAFALIDSAIIRHPGPTFDLFTWASAGGLLMDRLFASIVVPGEDTDQPDRFSAGSLSFSEISGSYMISRTHVKRLFSAAAELGSVGWSGPTGNSVVWLSRSFLNEYQLFQAEKYAIIDRALAAAL